MLTDLAVRAGWPSGGFEAHGWSHTTSRAHVEFLVLENLFAVGTDRCSSYLLCFGVFEPTSMNVFQLFS